MKIINKKIFLDEISGISVLADNNPKTATMQYRDSSGNEFVVPVSNIIRLFSVLQYEIERNDFDFEEFCNAVMNIEKKDDS